MNDFPSGAVLVTGAARRIGRAIVECLSTAQGVEPSRPVIIHSSSRSAAAARELATSLTRAGAKAGVIVADLGDPAQCSALIARVNAEFGAEFGPLCGLVNNAARFEADLARAFPIEGFDAHMAANLRAPLILARDFYAQAQNGAAIVNIIDQRVLRPTPDYFTYALSKAALWRATQTMAQSFAPRVRVNAVAPGPVLPNAHEGAEGFATEVAALPLKQAPTPQAIAEAVRWLMSAAHVTGQMIAVDGGQHLTS